MSQKWSPYARVYDPLTAGSIDGTDVIPHDKAIIRAMNSKYESPKVNTSKHRSLFVGALAPDINEEDLQKKFSVIGNLKSVKIVRDIVTGFSKGYGFVEYEHSADANEAYHELKGIMFNGKASIVDYECSRNLPNWIPRRLGGGWGGKKESGQLRFGCRLKPWKKPIIVHSSSESSIKQRI